MFITVLSRLKAVRGINNSVLAKQSGIPYTTIDGFYKKGCDNIKLSTLKKLSAYFDVTIDYLINGEEFKITNEEIALIKAYRSQPAMQEAVNILLAIDETDGQA